MHLPRLSRAPSVPSRLPWRTLLAVVLVSLVLRLWLAAEWAPARAWSWPSWPAPGLVWVLPQVMPGIGGAPGILYMRATSDVIRGLQPGWAAMTMRNLR